MPIIANSSGVATGTFAIPAGIPAGVKEVKATGSGGSVGVASYLSEGTIEVSTVQQLTTTIQFLQLYDPVAQTFTPTTDQMVSGLDIWITAKGSPLNEVTLQIREASLGLPTQNVIAQGRLAGSALVPGAFNRILLSVPVVAVAGREYCWVLLTDDPNHAIGVGELGKYGEAGTGLKEGWITQQPYQGGVLLSSSNASTWTVHQTMDAVFRLLVCDFTQNSLVVNLGSVTLTNLTDFMVRANVLRTSAATDVQFEFKKTNSPNAVWTVVEMQWIPLAVRYASAAIELRATLTGDANMSPILMPNTLILGGNIQETGNYVSRSILPEVAVGGSITNYDVTVTYECLRPGVATVTPSVLTWKLISGVEQVDGGGVPITEWKAFEPTTPAPVIKYVGDGWTQERYTFKTVRGVDLDRYTKVRLALTGNPQHRPQVRNLRVVLKPIP